MSQPRYWYFDPNELPNCDEHTRVTRYRTAIPFTMADAPAAAPAAAEGSDNQHKDPVTGEMISKSECLSFLAS
jgi:hypothetical protein